MSDPVIRPATLADAAACARVYAPYVTDSVISFEREPPTGDEFADRMRAAHVWLVAVADGDGGVAGYAYGSPHHARDAYRWSADVAIYLDAAMHGRGLGRHLYIELFGLLRDQGMRVLCAGVTLPNEASDGLHRAMGFEEVGVYRRIGFKHGIWHDVRWWQLDLAGGDDSPPAGAV